jgi:hypothetical protein
MPRPPPRSPFIDWPFDPSDPEAQVVERVDGDDGEWQPKDSDEDDGVVGYNLLPLSRGAAAAHAMESAIVEENDEVDNDNSGVDDSNADDADGNVEPYPAGEASIEFGTVLSSSSSSSSSAGSGAQGMSEWKQQPDDSAEDEAVFVIQESKPTASTKEDEHQATLASVPEGDKGKRHTEEPHIEHEREPDAQQQQTVAGQQ